MSLQVFEMLPRPVGMRFGPLLVTSRCSDLVRRDVLLVTDQIWTRALAMFLNNCHSTRGDGRLLSKAPAVHFHPIFDLSVRKNQQRVEVDGGGGSIDAVTLTRFRCLSLLPSRGTQARGGSVLLLMP